MLKKLDVYNNQLRELPDTIGQLEALKELNVSGNQLTELPGTISQLELLETLYVHNNPPQEPLQPLQRMSWKQFAGGDNHLKHLQASPYG